MKREPGFLPLRPGAVAVSFPGFFDLLGGAQGMLLTVAVEDGGSGGGGPATLGEPGFLAADFDPPRHPPATSVVLHDYPPEGARAAAA